MFYNPLDYLGRETVWSMPVPQSSIGPWIRVGDTMLSLAGIARVFREKSNDRWGLFVSTGIYDDRRFVCLLSEENELADQQWESVCEQIGLLK